VKNSISDRSKNPTLTLYLLGLREEHPETLDPEMRKDGGRTYLSPLVTTARRAGRSTRTTREKATLLRGLRLGLGDKDAAARPFDGGTPTLGWTRALSKGPTAAPLSSSIWISHSRTE
jgi:hypothetical protein